MNETYSGIVTRVIDGDTVEVSLNLGFGIRSSRTLRLMGINCPEKFGPAKEAGLKAKARTQELAEGKDCRVQVMGREKYGRDLGILNVIGDDGVSVTCVNDKLVIEGLAVNTYYKMVGGPDVDQAVTDIMLAVFEGEVSPVFNAEQFMTLRDKLKQIVGAYLYEEAPHSGV